MERSKNSKISLKVRSLQYLQLTETVPEHVQPITPRLKNIPMVALAKRDIISPIKGISSKRLITRAPSAFRIYKVDWEVNEKLHSTMREKIINVNNKKKAKKTVPKVVYNRAEKKEKKPDVEKVTKRLIEQDKQRVYDILKQLNEVAAIKEYKLLEFRKKLLTQKVKKQDIRVYFKTHDLN